MVDVKLLQEKIDQSGIGPVAIAAALGVSMPTYYKLKSGESEFTAAMIQATRVILNLTYDERDAIFFADDRE